MFAVRWHLLLDEVNVSKAEIVTLFESDEQEGGRKRNELAKSLQNGKRYASMQWGANIDPTGALSIGGNPQLGSYHQIFNAQPSSSDPVPNQNKCTGSGLVILGKCQYFRNAYSSCSTCLPTHGKIARPSRHRANVCKLSVHGNYT